MSCRFKSLETVLFTSTIYNDNGKVNVPVLHSDNNKTLYFSPVVVHYNLRGELGWCNLKMFSFMQFVWMTAHVTNFQHDVILERGLRVVHKTAK